MHRGNRATRERHLRVERTEEFLRMDDIAGTVHVRVFILCRALPFGELCEIGHESGNEAFEEGHHEHDLDPRELPHELPDAL